MPDQPYLFYEVMDYPLPRQKEFFAYRVGKDPRGIGLVEPPTWSKYSEQFKEYRDFVKKWKWVWRHIPFIEAVFVANSLTFNALHDESDIDLFIVTNVNRLWLGRLMSVFVMRILRLKRSSSRIAKKFCLSFTVSRDACNLQEIKLNPHDPYLIYWVAHLVPIYFQFEEHEINIYKENSWIQFYLPNHPLEQTVDLGIGESRGVGKIRKSIERFLSGYFGDAVEWLIKMIWLPIVLWKRKRLGLVGKDCIISDKMLKFHHDKRRMYALKWKMALKCDE